MGGDGARETMVMTGGAAALLRWRIRLSWIWCGRTPSHMLKVAVVTAVEAAAATTVDATTAVEAAASIAVAATMAVEVTAATTVTLTAAVACT